MNFEKSEMGRRDFLTGLGAFAGAASMSPSKIEAQEKIEMLRAVSLPETFEYDADKIESLLQSDYEIRDLSDEDLEELCKLAQNTFLNLFAGSTVQEHLAYNFPNANPEIDVVIAANDPETGFESEGAFLHGRGTEHSKLYLREGLGVPDAVNVLIHEMVHGAFGTGEVRAEFNNILAQMIMYADQEVPHLDSILEKNFTLSSWYSRELDASGLISMEYVTLPMTAVILTARELDNTKMYLEYGGDSAAPTLLYSFTNSLFFSSGDSVNKLETAAEELLLVDGGIDVERFFNEFLVASEIILKFINKNAELPEPS
jgi:hypothetical protein